MRGQQFMMKENKSSLFYKTEELSIKPKDIFDKLAQMM